MFLIKRPFSNPRSIRRDAQQSLWPNQRKRRVLAQSRLYGSQLASFTPGRPGTKLLCVQERPRAARQRQICKALSRQLRCFLGCTIAKRNWTPSFVNKNKSSFSFATQ